MFEVFHQQFSTCNDNNYPVCFYAEGLIMLPKTFAMPGKPVLFLHVIL